MVELKKHSLCRLVSSVLISLLLLGNISIHTQNKADDPVQTVLLMMERHQYSDAVSVLEAAEGKVGKDDVQLKARIYLLYAANYEKMDKPNLANAYLMKIQLMIEGGELKKIPDIPGIDLRSLDMFREIRQMAETTPLPPEVKEEKKPDGYHFNFKEPEPVKSQKEKEVIHYEGRRMKKKKFPWLPVIAGLVIVGTILYFVLTQENKKEVEYDLPEIDWIHIPAGEFIMGDNFAEGDSDEQPVHMVSLDGYSISKYEISITQYDNFCLATGRRTLTIEYNLPTWWKQYPAHYISWQDASDFCQWLSQETGSDIHLPTEAQWERAARGSTQNRYPWGNNAPTCELANFQGCGGFLDQVTYNPAGATASGILNMAGNIAEWCQDWYGSEYYSQSPNQNPQGPSIGSKRVVRGGSLQSQALEIRSAARDARSPSEKLISVGFRIVKED